MKSLRQHSASIYMWTVVAAGVAAVLYAAYTLPRGIIDGYFLLLTLVTAVIGSRIAIRIPQINVNITVDDTFVFIALLLYGGEAAVMIGALAGICSALRISRKVRTVAFGSAALACAVLATATVLKYAFGTTTNLVNNGASLADHCVVRDGSGPVSGPYDHRRHCQRAQSQRVDLAHVES